MVPIGAVFMRVTVNGDARDVAGPLSVLELLDQLGIDGRKVALERNLGIVPRSAFVTTAVADGDAYEIVHFIGGGNDPAPALEPGALTLGGQAFQSRLIVGTGKYRDFDETREAVAASGAEIVTVAVRRVNLTDPGQPMLVDYLDPKVYTYLPNTAGCHTADEAVRTLRLAREAGGWSLVKLEVLGDERTLYPDMPETVRASETLVKEGFDVMVYCSDDPIQAKRLEDIGCCAIMPLAAPIGSGLGIQNPVTLRIIIENAKVPVIVDAGVGTASDAALAMELGCDAILMNTGIAAAKDPIMMAEAMRDGVIAGRKARLAGRMPMRLYAHASSPIEGLVTA